MKHYEIMFILKPNLEESALKSTVKDLEKALTLGKAKITLSKELGQKELAYEIDKFKSGFYYLYNVEADNSDSVKEFERVARINENVIRHIVINLDK